MEQPEQTTPALCAAPTAYASSRSRLTSTHHPLLVYHCQSVIRHEYGHFSASLLARRSSTGGLVQVITKTPSPPPTLSTRTPSKTLQTPSRPTALPDSSRSGRENWTWRGENRNLLRRLSTFGETAVTTGRHVSRLYLRAPSQKARALNVLDDTLLGRSLPAHLPFDSRRNPSSLTTVDYSPVSAMARSGWNLGGQHGRLYLHLDLGLSERWQRSWLQYRVRRSVRVSKRTCS